MPTVCTTLPCSSRRVKALEVVTPFLLLGQWKGPVPIPDHDLETLEERLEDDEKEDFLRFLRRMLCWLPEERATAKELLFDPWLMHGLFR